MSVKKNTMADRPEIKTKTELKKWVEEQSAIGKEYPWSEDCWKESDKRAKEISEIRKEKARLGGEFSKGRIVTKKCLDKFSENPCINYFKLRGIKPFVTEDRIFEEEEKKRQFKEVKDKFGTAYLDKNISEEDECPWFENWISYFNISEQQYLRTRFKSYMNDFEISAASDQSMLMQILATEILLYRLNIEICIPNYKADAQDVKQRDILSTQLKNLLSEQQWTQKSQGKKVSDDSKFTTMMVKLLAEGYTVPEIEIEEDELDLILHDLNEAIIDMKM